MYYSASIFQFLSIGNESLVVSYPFDMSLRSYYDYNLGTTAAHLTSRLLSLLHMYGFRKPNLGLSHALLRFEENALMGGLPP
jgi:hypothetical protein